MNHPRGEFYADFDEGSGLWCVFHTDKGNRAFASYADKDEARADAEGRNKAQTGTVRFPRETR